MGGTIDCFSSYGPTFELTLQPKIDAPGGNILSTWPLEWGGYALLSGTSMAAPFISGSLALLKSQQPQFSVAELYARLMATATPLKEYRTGGTGSTGRAGGLTLVASTARQGGGLVDAYAPVYAQTAVSWFEIDLRDSDFPVPQKSQ